MSTDLYGIRILASEPQKKQIKCKVIAVYYSEHVRGMDILPDDNSFFLRMFYERSTENSPLKQAITVDEYLSEEWVNANTFRFIKSYQVSKLKNARKNMGEYDNFYHLNDKGKWHNESKLVQAEFLIEVTDKKWLEGLEVGDYWGTTCYETVSLALSISEEHAHALPQFHISSTDIIPFEVEENSNRWLWYKSTLFSPDKQEFYIVGDQSIREPRATKHFVTTISLSDAKLIKKEEGITNEKNKTKTIGEVIVQDRGKTTLAHERPIKRDFRITDHVKYIQFYDEKGIKTERIEQQKRNNCLIFTKDNRYLATSGERKNKICVYDVSTKLSIVEIQNDWTKKGNYSLCFDKTEQYLMHITHDHKSIVIHHWQTNEVVLTFTPVTKDRIEKVDWSPDGKYVVVVFQYYAFLTNKVKNPAVNPCYIKIFKLA